MTEHKHNDDEPRAGAGRYGGTKPTDPVPTPKEPRPDGDETSGLPKGYDPIPYPKMVYHTNGASRTVQNELEEDVAEMEGYTLDAPPPPPEPATSK